MGKLYKTVKRTDVKLGNIYFQYVPGRFEQAFEAEPSADTLHVSCLPHCDLLRKYIESKETNLLNTDYYLMYRAWKRDIMWIKKRIKRFVKLFDNISRNGLKTSIIITKKPLHRKFHGGYEIYDGHHRAVICLVLGHKTIASEIVEFI